MVVFRTTCIKFSPSVPIVVVSLELQHTSGHYARARGLFDRIKKYAASHDAQELPICTWSSDFPDVFGSLHACYQSMKVLESTATRFPKRYDELWSCLPMLESLTLTRCVLSLDDDSFGNFPRLGTLKLLQCSCYRSGILTNVLKVTGPNLLNLEITLPEFVCFQIVAPKLQSFILKMNNMCMITDVSMWNLTSLTRANIKIGGYEDEFCSKDFCGLDAIKQQVLEEFVNLFKVLHNVQALDLEVEMLEVLI